MNLIPQPGDSKSPQVLPSAFQNDIYIPTSMMPHKLKRKVGLFLVWIHHDTEKELRKKVAKLTKICGGMLDK